MRLNPPEFPCLQALVMNALKMCKSEEIRTELSEGQSLREDTIFPQLLLWPRELLLTDLLLVGDKETARGLAPVFLKKIGLS